MSVGLLLPAAGSGTRFGGPKQLVELAGRAILLRALDPFVGQVSDVVVATSPELRQSVEALLARQSWSLRVRVVLGGERRAESVSRALAALDPRCELVLVHDAARPLLRADIVQRAIAALAQHDGVIVAESCTATLKEVDDGSPPLVRATVPRERYRLAQTPQGFRRAVGEAAFARPEAGDCTDEAQVLERAGVAVAVVPGDPANIKVTTPEDLALAEALWRVRRGSCPDA